MPGCRDRAAGPSVLGAIERFHLARLARHGGSIGIDGRKALQSILTCRAEAMGGRSFRCDHCGGAHFAWRSCNHRLCPVCGSADTAQWVAGRLEDRLPVAHYMVTFTLPSQLRGVCREAPKPFLKACYSRCAR